MSTRETDKQAISIDNLLLFWAAYDVYSNCNGAKLIATIDCIYVRSSYSIKYYELGEKCTNKCKYILWKNGGLAEPLKHQKDITRWPGWCRLFYGWYIGIIQVRSSTTLLFNLRYSIKRLDSDALLVFYDGEPLVLTHNDTTHFFYQLIFPTFDSLLLFSYIPRKIVLYKYYNYETNIKYMSQQCLYIL